MEKNFWDSRWASDAIGFHAPAPNAELVRHFDALEAARPLRKALVPLCGKSLDLRWLGERLDHVLGVEFVEQAVTDFFREGGLTPHEEPLHGLPSYRARNLQLVLGDFFALPPAATTEVDFYYDRAALIALPRDMRGRYARHVAELLPPAARGLLVTIDYDQAIRSGPPFAVTDEEVEALYGGDFRLERLERRPVEDPPRGLDRGAFTSTWRLERR